MNWKKLFIQASLLFAKKKEVEQDRKYTDPSNFHDRVNPSKKAFSKRSPHSLR
jgi:hypothetical protein